MRKALLVSLVLLLLAAALLQWGVDATPAGSGGEEDEVLPAASNLLDFLGGVRQYLAYTFYIKTDKLHHLYYGSEEMEAELVPYFELAALLDPDYESAYYVGAGIMAIYGRIEQAIAFTRQGLDANPESADLLYSLGDLYLMEKRFEEARAAFEEALRYEPELVSRNMMLSALAASCAALGDEEGQRAALMDKAIYNQVWLYDEGLPYETGKGILKLINQSLNSAMEVGEDAGE